MNTKVQITANKAGQAVTSNNNGYGFIRVSQTRMSIDERTGFAKPIVLSALIKGKVEHLDMFGYSAGEVLPGKIVIKESLEPFNTKNPEKDYKIAGDTGIICCADGQPIYRNCFYNVSGTDTDELIAHTNADAIRDAFASVELESEEISL
jgi:hypothetical protein